MKKKYIAPTMDAIEMKSHSILCGSITEDDNSLKATFDETEFGDNETIN